MNKLLQAMLISVMFSQSALALSNSTPPVKTNLDVIRELAKRTGMSVAECVSGLCRDTEDGYYVTIDNSDRDGFYIYDPLITMPSGEDDTTSPQN
jgi:hypothetical protein